MLGNIQPSKQLLQKQYRLTRTIGQGGFGKTYLAEDKSKQNLPRCVVKQFFPTSLSNDSDQAKEMFCQKVNGRAQALGFLKSQIKSKLQHWQSLPPKTVEIVMELLVG